MRSRAAAACAVAGRGVVDVVSGVTYGGVSMARINRAVDSLGEPGSCYAYFLGAGIPTGGQTVQVTISAGVTAKFGVAMTVTAATDTELAGIGSVLVQADTANPSVTITGIYAESFGFAGLFSGQNNPASITAGTGMTLGPTNDYGNQSAAALRSTSQNASGNLTIAYSATSEDAAMVGFAIQERKLLNRVRMAPQSVNRSASY